MRRVFWFGLALTLPGCRAPGGGPGGEVTLTWTGASAGQVAAAAEASWCARDTLLELIAVRNDTAVGFALLPKDSLGPGTYSVFSTTVFIPFRPQANLAFRYLDSSELKGYEGLSGSVTLSETAGGKVSGELEASLKLQAGTDTLRLVGRFRDVPVAPALASCGRANKPPPG